MTDDRDGTVVTFYSYKGGTGRTMALANVAWILAANGKRVLVLDWDLESPGLHRFFVPFLDRNLLASTNGVIDLIREYEHAAADKLAADKAAGRDPDPRWTPDAAWVEQYARVHKYSFSLRWEHFPPGAALDFITAGRQNRDYAHAVSSLNWDDFYDKLGGGAFFDALRADMKRHYDYTLIDSRTGLSDVADICTIHLPDVLVDCFTLSEQGINGAKEIADLVPTRLAKDRQVHILPVPMRIDPAEKRKADAGRLVAKQRFEGLPTGLGEAERDTYWSAMQVPYQAYYGYEESLATFGDLPGSPGSLLSHYEILTGYLTNGEVQVLPRLDDQLRRRVNDEFVRRPEDLETEVLLRYEAPDQVWAEWIDHVLTAAGVRVLDPWVRLHDGSHPARPSARELRVVSRMDGGHDDPVGLPAGLQRDPLVLYVADVPVQSQPASYARLAGLDEEGAVTQLLRLVGRPPNEVRGVMQQAGPRYPATDPSMFNVPTRNARFTGREDDLRRLRTFLRSGGTVGAGATTAALLGMGGLGKTHVALEYAHRFRSAYDLVFWIAADPYTFIDTQLLDLAPQLGVQPLANGPDTTRAVLSALNRNEPHLRWLLIYDNADDLRTEKLLPSGQGHVIITSRNPTWSDRATAIQLEVFDREESVALIRKRNSALSDVDAGQVADLLGDLPIAVSAASAWLADTGLPVRQYIDEIQRLGPTAIQLEDTEASVAATWKLSLDRLRERSPAASRLLELCSVLAPEIALDLVYGDALAQTLVSMDPSVRERMVRATLVQHLNRLALLRVDQRGEAGPVGEHGERARGGQIIMHRLLQLMVRSELGEEEVERTRHEIHQVLANVRPDEGVDDPETWPLFRMLWPHVEASEAVHCEDETVRRLMVDRVRYLWLRGDLERGRLRAVSTDEAWRDLLASTEGLNERRSIETQLLNLRFNHANILRSQGEFEQSRKLNDQTLHEQRALLGATHPHTLLTAGGLAADLRGLGRYSEALEQDSLTYAAWLDVCGEDDPQTLAALNNLATAHRLMGHYREARERDEIAYQKRRRVLGETHPRTLASLGSLARDLRDAGEYDRSVELLRTLVDMLERVPGQSSGDMFNAKANLAVSLRSSGRVDEAAELLDEAVDGLRGTRGENSPDFRAARLSRAVNRIAQRQYGPAKHEMHAIHVLYENNLGAKHPHTLACLTNLGIIHRAFSEHSEAIRLNEEAVGSLEDMLGSTHPFTLDSRTNLAVCLADGGKAEAAERVLAETLPNVVKVYGRDHPVTLRCRADLGLITRRVQRSDTDAEHARVLEQLTRAIGATHPTVLTLRNQELVARTVDPHPF
jgi:tetratricopeptide (TPR) repeat protein